MYRYDIIIVYRYDILVHDIYKLYTYQDTDPYELLEQDIEKFNKTGEVVLIGDFNARTGNKIDYVSDFNDDDAETFVRNSDVTV